MGMSLNNLPKLQNKAEKVYPTKEACIARLVEATTYGQLTEEAAKTLCVRGIAPADNGYVFTRDPKLKLAPMPHETIEVTKAFLIALKCPVFVIKAQESFFSTENMEMMLKFVADARMTTVDGNHFIHLNNAPLVASIVDKELV